MEDLLSETAGAAIDAVAEASKNAAITLEEARELILANRDKLQVFVIDPTPGIFSEVSAAVERGYEAVVGFIEENPLLCIGGAAVGIAGAAYWMKPDAVNAAIGSAATSVRGWFGASTPEAA